MMPMKPHNLYLKMSMTIVAQIIHVMVAALTENTRIHFNYYLLGVNKMMVFCKDCKYFSSTDVTYYCGLMIKKTRTVTGTTYSEFVYPYFAGNENNDCPSFKQANWFQKILNHVRKLPGTTPSSSI